MVGESAALKEIDLALGYSRADQTEVVMVAQESDLTRFANSAIHQNVNESNAVLYIRVAMGKRLGSASTNRLEERHVRSAIDQAIEIAKHSPENPDFASFAKPERYRQVHGFVQATADCTPILRANMVEDMLKRSDKHSLKAAGAISTGTREVAIGNSLGVRAYYASSSAALRTVMMSADSSGYADAISTDVGALEPGPVAEVAIQKCLAGRKATRVDPGEYVVVLEPSAVATAITYLTELSFNARAYQEERSFVYGRLGQQVLGSNISIWDDGLDTNGMPMPFDYEGVPKRRIELIRNGVAAGLVYDTITAGKEGKESNGCAPPPEVRMWSTDPAALNIFMNEGDASLDAMIGSIERGLLVTRFHYVNPVHPKKGILTGMTRDGTFLIEGGRIASGIKNMRFTQSMVEALQQVEMISSARQLKGEEYMGVAMVPALKIGAFNFTGVTEF